MRHISMRSMRRGIAAISFIWFGISSSLSQEMAQPSKANLSFDAVSIRQIEAYKRISSGISTSYVNAPHKPCVFSDDRVICQLTLGELIKEAYQRKRYEVTGPKWLDEDRFIFQGIFADKTSKEDVRLMMQRALEDRFALRSHTESRQLPVFQLVVGPNGLHITPAAPPEKQKPLAGEGRPGASVLSSSGHFAAVAISIDTFCTWVQRIAGLDRPLINGTGLDGKYQLDLKWDPPDDTDAATPLQDTGITGALRTQAGLVLHKENALVDMLVIDTINRTPTPN